MFNILENIVAMQEMKEYTGDQSMYPRPESTQESTWYQH